MPGFQRICWTHRDKPMLVLVQFVGDDALCVDFPHKSSKKDIPFIRTAPSVLRELEVTTKGRMETQVGRLKETIERLNKEVDDIRIKEQSSQDQQKKMGRQLRDLKEDYATLQGKESDLVQKNGDLEKQIEVSDVEVMTLKSDLKLAMKRIEDLQVAISGDIEDDA